MIALCGVLSLATWLYLLAGRGFFWRIRETPVPRLKSEAKRVAVIVPARDEAPVIGRAVSSLLAQDYRGTAHLFVVDDHSSDDTAAIVRRVAETCEASERITVVSARDLPPGWTGKLWAISEGLQSAATFHADFYLLTDADIVHAPDNLAGLVARAEASGFDVVSYMVKLRCRTFAERALIPAFVFFFFMLYPPAWIARRDRKTAGAAGGCILIRSSALERIDGVRSIRGELIDDCALAREVKRTGGGVWLGVTSGTCSIRDYETFGEAGHMIARTAFTQLRYSTLLLAGTVIGLAITYLAPPALLMTHSAALGLAAWLLMSIAFLPTIRFYGLNPLWALGLPAIAAFYLGATVYSAIQHWRGERVSWKGR